MSDVGKVPGDRPLRPAEESKDKGKSPKAFPKRKRVDKVGKVDPEEKRRRKSQTEAEQEKRADQRSAPSLHQGLEPGPPPPPPSYTPQRGDEVTSTVETAGPPEKKKEKRKKTEEAQKAAPTQPHAAKKEKKAKKKAATVPSKTHPPEATGISLPVSKESPPSKAEPAKKEELHTEPSAATQAPPSTPPPLPSGGWESVKSSAEEEKAAPAPSPTEPEAQAAALQPEASLHPAAPLGEAPPPLVAAFAHLPPHIAQVFEQMVGVMTVMDLSGITETSITLDNPQFAQSVFYGAQITITEYATAPKAFNIELSGNQQALNLMGAHTEELVAAFAAGNYNFKVNRIDLSQQRSIGEVRRKELKRVKRKQSGGS